MFRTELHCVLPPTGTVRCTGNAGTTRRHSIWYLKPVWANPRAGPDTLVKDLHFRSRTESPGYIQNTGATGVWDHPSGLSCITFGNRGCITHYGSWFFRGLSCRKDVNSNISETKTALYMSQKIVRKGNLQVAPPTYPLIVKLLWITPLAVTLKLYV